MVAKQMTLDCEVAPWPLPTTIEKHLTAHSALLRELFKKKISLPLQNEFTLQIIQKHTE
jgi:hypothetical protein